MIKIYSERRSHAFYYIVKIIFERIVQVSYEIIHSLEGLKEGDFLIDYSQNGIGKGLLLPNSGFLFQKKFDEFFPDFVEAPFPKLFYLKGTKEDSIDFDIFSASFYLITEYPHYFQQEKDVFGRISEKESFIFKNGFHKRPLLHVYSSIIAEELKKEGWSNSEVKKKFSYQITVDVDRPWRFKNKGFFVFFGGIIKSLLRGGFQEFIEGLRVGLGRKDPFDTYQEILQKVPFENLVFFFLEGHDAKMDNRFKLNSPEIKKLVLKLRNNGAEVGIHPSFHASEKTDLIRQQRNLLCAPPWLIRSSRQHFLKTSLPASFMALSRLGIKREYSVACVTDLGFRTGMCCPYPWFDLLQNEETSLEIWPAVAMDRTLQKYLKLSPEEALIRTKEMVKIVKDFRGKCIIIFHNETFSDYGEWKGWRKMALEVIAHLKK